MIVQHTYIIIFLKIQFSTLNHIQGHITYIEFNLWKQKQPPVTKKI